VRGLTRVLLCASLAIVFAVTCVTAAPLFYSLR
jgi:hypothetical protein